MNPESSPTLALRSFCTTRWSVVSVAKSKSENGRAALADLCAAYYEPVLAFVRCELRDSEAARELSHAFFAEMLAGGALQRADRAHGRFRSYLLGAVKHFLSHQRQFARRLKRGGGAEAVALDEEEVQAVPDPRQIPPDAEFDRQWAITVLQRGLAALEEECRVEGRELFYNLVKPLLTGDLGHGEQSGLAAACGMNVTAFRMAIHRLKKRLRQRVKEEVAGTLDDPAIVQEELQSLFAALGG